MSEVGVRRGDLPEKEFDIYCPLMGGPDYKRNYLASSCRDRVGLGSCKLRDCVQRGGTATEAPERMRANGRQPYTQKKNLSKRGICTCGCEREGRIVARGLIKACYDRWYRLEKKGLGHTFGPPKKVKGSKAGKGRAKPAQKKSIIRRSDAPEILTKAIESQKPLEDLPGEPVLFTPGAVSLLAAYNVGRRYRALNILINPYFSLSDEPVSMLSISVLADQFKKGWQDYADELAAEVS